MNDFDLSDGLNTLSSMPHAEFESRVEKLVSDAIALRIDDRPDLGKDVDQAIQNEIGREEARRQRLLSLFDQQLAEAGRSNKLTAVGRAGAAAATDSVRDAFANEVSTQLGKTRGRKNPIKEQMKGVPQEALVEATLREIARGVMSDPLGRALTDIELAIGEAMEREINLQRALELGGSVLQGQLENINVAWQRHARVRQILEQQSEGFVKLDMETRSKMGTLLVSWFLRSQPQGSAILEQKSRMRTNPKKLTPSPRQELVLTAEGRLFFERALANHRGLIWDHVPSLIPLKAYTTILSGGYWSAVGTRHGRLIPGRLFKTHRKLLTEEPYHAHGVMLAVACSQALTSWRINPRVLPFWTEVINSGGGVGGMPYANPSGSGENVEAAGGGWDTEDAHHDAVWLKQIEEVVKQFSVEDRFYLAYSVDFRGRLYCRTKHLNPQGPGWLRCLMEFGVGKPIDTADAERWLKIHVANKFGLDKKTFAERIEWVDSNEEKLRAIANGSDESWKNLGGDAWLALAACLEYVAYLENEDGDFVSHLPVTVDGSCNALQHYAALSADQELAGYVNLLPRTDCEDFYRRLMERVQSKLQTLVGEPKKRSGDMPLAKKWKSNLKRAAVKQAAIQFMYGSTRQKMGDAVTAWLRDQHGSEQQGSSVPFTVGELTEAGQLLAKHCESAIKEMAKGAVLVRAWLTRMAKGCNAEGIPIEWSSASGWVVVQDYPKQKTVRSKFNTAQNGKSAIQAQRTLLTETDDRDTRKQTAALSANFVHSMDAAHLATVITSACFCPPGDDASIDHVMHIHDSFGTHAADMPRLQRCIREAFIQTYAGEAPLTRFAQALDDAGVKNVSVPPITGGLDFEQIRDAEYCFS